MSEKLLEDGVPLFTNKEDRNQFMNRCFEESKPAFFVNKIGRRTWAHVECDFISTDGWTTTTYRGREIEAEAQLTPEAVGRVNEVLSGYEDVEQRTDKSIGALSTSHGATFISFPEMRESVAKQLAEEVKPIFWNEENWEIPEKQRGKWE